MPRAKMEQVLKMEIKLPALVEQTRIVEEIRAESFAVAAARNLIEIYQAKIQLAIRRLWDIN